MPDMTEITARDALSDAIGYWEPRRLIYNGVMLVVVAAVYYSKLPASRDSLNVNTLQGLFVLAVLANIAYCAAHAVDVVAQLSAFRERWLRMRWMLLLLGVVFAAVLANFFAQGMLAGPMDPAFIG
jgi:hypothetical protein